VRLPFCRYTGSFGMGLGVEFTSICSFFPLRRLAIPLVVNSLIKYTIIMNPTTSRAAVRSMATLTHATRATPAARNLLSAAVRTPAFARSLSSNTRQFAQFPRLQSFTFSNKRAFGSTASMVCLGNTSGTTADELMSFSPLTPVLRAMPSAKSR
jgi:hypothetical protein